MRPYQGHVFWIFGLCGAGKSTVASALIDDLRARSVPLLALDGDTLRSGLCRGLGFSDDDRTENLRRAAEAAKLGADSGLCVVASFITPLESHRRLVQEIIGSGRLSLVLADAPLEVCRQRDVKGLYARAQAGQVQQMTGISSLFEKPSRTDLTLATSAVTPAVSARMLIDFAKERLSGRRWVT
jgi:adenylyl-sulfate kinase